MAAEDVEVEAEYANGSRGTPHKAHFGREVGPSFGEEGLLKLHTGQIHDAALVVTTGTCTGLASSRFALSSVGPAAASLR